jgi:hypothetical protein
MLGGMGIGLASFLVFTSGFFVMVLEIVGARLLARDFGSAFYVWTSQIGVVLLALALGYAAGGAFADRYQSLRFLSRLLIPAGVLTFFIPKFSGPLINAIITRHPLNEEIPLAWQKLDPALGSALIFFVPCCALAMLPPYLIRLQARTFARLGTVSGGIISMSTLGSIAGVFVSGYWLIDWLRLPTIFQLTGAGTVGLGLLCLGQPGPAPDNPSKATEPGGPAGAA